MSRSAIAVCFIAGGALVGLVLSLDWKPVRVALQPYAPLPGLLLGVVAGLVLFLAWDQRARLPFSARVTALKIKLPAIGEVEIATTPAERIALWRFFVELNTRVATRALADDEGSLREALESLHGLFASARRELATLPPASVARPPRALSAQVYVLRVLNEELRPFLSRWHPRLSSWEHSHQPEAYWPLAIPCRRDLAATRERVLAHVWALGDALGFAGLDELLPPPPASLPELMLEKDIRQLEARSLPTLDPDRSRAGWRIFAETVSRIATQPLGPGEGVLSEALASLYALFGTVREELKALSPPLAPSESGDTVEAISLTLLNEHLRPFLAKWHPQILAFEKKGHPEAERTLAEACRADLVRMQAGVVAQARRLAAVLGIHDADRLLGPLSRGTGKI